jgi:serine phosphatase RsbU (regulator of sigma subunit)
MEERALADLLRNAHLSGDFDLPELFADYGRALGVAPLLTYLADLQQRVLIPFVTDGSDHHLEPLAVDSTLAGRAFQHVEMLTQPEPGGPTRLWLPLLDGTERLGLLTCVVPGMDALEADGGALWTRLRTFAAVAAELIMTKTLYGDTLVRLRRTSELTLAAEKQWSILPPLTFANHLIIVSAGLEPAYEVAGDTVDYAVDPRLTHLAIFDGMGHGLRSAQLAALAVSAYRNARRGGHDLVSTVRWIDEAVAGAFGGDGFLTGQLAQLDTHTGLLRWVNAGHPDPLLLRDSRLVKELHARPVLPMGLGELSQQDDPHVGTETLEPGDLVLFYSDGVVEARSPAGTFFGVERLAELVTRHLAAGLPPPETTRRVIRSLLEHQEGRLEDDATLLLAQYRPLRPSIMLP